MLAILSFAGCYATAQQDYVPHYDLYGGFTYFESPHIDLAERGFHTQIGTNPKTWYGLGFDYSVVTGRSPLTPNLLPVSLQQQLGAELQQLAAAGLIPPGFNLVIPVNSKTQTFAAGPQFNYRHFSRVTLFIRPSLGAVHEMAVPRPQDPISSAIVMQLAPAGKKQDWAGFYGLGGGFDLNTSKHLVLRMQADFVHDHLFNDLLKDGRNTVRVSIGPAFHFGRNIAQ
jgi:hypothetical protein